MVHLTAHRVNWAFRDLLKCLNSGYSLFYIFVCVIQGSLLSPPVSSDVCHSIMSVALSSRIVRLATSSKGQGNRN